jgi:PAS domain S-box-containing protein
MAPPFRWKVRFACTELRGQRLFIVLCRDISDGVRARTGAPRARSRFRRIVETNLLGIVFWEDERGVHDANDEFLRIVGYTRRDLEAGTIDLAAMTPPEHRAEDARAQQELHRTGRHAPIEKEYVRKDGSRVWVLVGSAFTDAQRGVGFVLDISRQKRTEAALRDSEQVARDAAARAENERRVLDAILEAAPAGIIVTDADGKLVRFNPAIELLWGPAPFASAMDEHGEWKGWWADDSPRRGRRIQPHEWAMARALSGETVRDDIVEIEPFEAAGARRTIVNSGAPVRDADGRVIGSVIAQLDISARVAAEDARRDSEARFRALADNIAQLAWMADETGAIFWFNQRWFEYSGTTLEDASGWGWTELHHPEHAERVIEKLRRCFETGDPWEDTFPIRGKDGSYRWFLSRAVPIRDSAGRVMRWFGTNTDVTAQRTAEEALRDADRRKDEFIGVLAHELRNPLAPVRMAVEIMRRVGPAEPARPARARRDRSPGHAHGAAHRRPAGRLAHRARQAGAQVRALRPDAHRAADGRGLSPQSRGRRASPRRRRSGGAASVGAGRSGASGADDRQPAAQRRPIHRQRRRRRSALRDRSRAAAGRRPRDRLRRRHRGGTARSVV